MDYIRLIDMPNMKQRTSRRRSDVDMDDFTSESVEEVDLRLYEEHDAISLGGKKQLKITVANLLIDFIFTSTIFFIGGFLYIDISFLSFLIGSSNIL